MRRKYFELDMRDVDLGTATTDIVLRINKALRTLLFIINDV